jgi:NDP-sugar pyrophosphorylase family protein
MNDASILDGVELYDCVVGVGAKINSGVKLRSVVIGDHAEIGKDIELSSGTRVWPDVVLNIR